MNGNGSGLDDDRCDHVAQGAAGVRCQLDAHGPHVKHRAQRGRIGIEWPVNDDWIEVQTSDGSVCFRMPS